MARTKATPRPGGDPGVAQRLREFRRSRGLAQKELAVALDISPKVVSMWETGARRLPLHRALKLIELYPDLSLDWLLLGKGPRPVDALSERLDSLEREVAELKGRNDIPAGWVDDFLTELNRPEVVKEVASIFTSVRADERGRTLKPHEIDEVIADAAPRLLDRFREYVDRRRRQG